MSAKINSGIKLAVVGALVVCFLYLLIWGVIYIFDGQIKVSDDLMLLVKIPQFGFIRTAVEPNCFIDRWLYKLKYRGKKDVATDEVYDILASVISVNAYKKNVKELSIIWNGFENGSGKVANRLAEIIDDKCSLKVNVINDIVDNVNSIDKMSDVKSVVIVETAGNTLYTNLYKENQLLNQLEIPILGGIIVG